MDAWLENINDEDRVFIKKFILSSGSLKKLSEEYRVSYPTIRLRLDRLIEKIKINESDTNFFKSNIMQMAIDENIDLESARKIISLYELDKEGHV
ncbi:TPA: DUF2089 family protein [Staphylococcus aureus]